ncbi:MAG: N-acetylglucosamine kinase, partial [Planctomycetota bacterium]
VTETADEGDAVARQIVDEAGKELASMAAAVARKLGFPGGRFSLSLAGGALLSSEILQKCLKTHVGSLGLVPGPVVEVPEPVLGALRLAQADATGP